MKRELECSIEDLLLLNQQIAEFQKNSEEEETFVIPVKISYTIHVNEQEVVKHMVKYDNQRLELIRKHVEFDENGNAKTAEVEVHGKKQRNYVLKDEKAYEVAHTKLLQEKIKIKFYVYKEDENDLKGMSGKQKILNQMWCLIDIFSNWNNPECINFKTEIEQIAKEGEKSGDQ